MTRTTRVIGVDSSTQSTKAVLVDADDGTVRRAARRAASSRHRCRPAPLARRLRRRGRRLARRGRRRRGRRPAARHGRPRRRRPARPRRAALERHPFGRRRDDAGRRDGRCPGLRRRRRQRARRVVHLDQAALAARSPTRGRGGGDPRCCCPTTTSRGTSPATDRAVHRPRRRLGHRLLLDARTTPGAPTWPSRRSATTSRCRASSPTGRRRTRTRCWSSAGTGDNMAAALALDLVPGDVVVSIGTSGVASAISEDPVADGTGAVTGFADATGRFLPMATTMNAAAHPRPAGAPARRRPRRARPPGARRAAGANGADDLAVLRRRAHAQPSARDRHLGGADGLDHPRGPRPRRLRGAAVLARRRRRPAGEP